MDNQNKRDYIYTYKSKTPEGCAKRMVMIFLNKDNGPTPNIVSITKYVVVKKETIDAAGGSFSTENGWTLLRKFSTFSLFRQTIIMTVDDLFSLNGMFATIRHYSLQQEGKKPEK